MFLAQCWRLETSSRPVYDFIKMTIIFNSWYLQFLIFPYLRFQKNETLGFWVIGLEQVAELKKTWNLALVPQIIQKIHENYCPCIHLSIGQVWWLNELWFKRYNKNSTLSHVLILIMTSVLIVIMMSQIWKIMGLFKIQKLEYLEKGT